MSKFKFRSDKLWSKDLRTTTLMLCFILFSTGLSAQKTSADYYIKKKLKQNGLDVVFTVLEEDRHGVWFYNNSKFYHWYKSQTVLSTQGEASGELLHGDYEAYFDNKQLAEKGHFNKGLKSGEWKYWSTNGMLLKKERWIRGELRGETILYDESGEEVIKMRIHRGNSSRISKDSIVQTKKTKERISLLDEDGNIVRIEEKKNGVLHGRVKTIEKSRVVKLEIYDNGTLVETRNVDTKKKIKDIFHKQDKETKKHKDHKKKEKQREENEK